MDEWTILIIAERGGGYYVEIPQLPGCISQGETVADALVMIEKARQAWLETAEEELAARLEARGGEE